MSTETVNWNLTIPAETDRDVRAWLAEHGQSGDDIARFVERTVRKAIFRQMLADSRGRNADLSDEEAQALVDEAVAAVRAEKRRARETTVG